METKHLPFLVIAVDEPCIVQYSTVNSQENQRGEYTMLIFTPRSFKYVVKYRKYGILFNHIECSCYKFDTFEERLMHVCNLTEIATFGIDTIGLVVGLTGPLVSNFRNLIF